MKVFGINSDEPSGSATAVLLNAKWRTYRIWGIDLINLGTVGTKASLNLTNKTCWFEHSSILC